MSDEQAVGPDKFGDLLLDLADKAARDSVKEGSKGSSLPVYLLLVCLVVVGFAVMGWITVRAKRQAAQMEYELRLQVEEQKRLIESAKLAQDASTRIEAEGKASALSTSIQELQEKLSAIEATAVERARVLASATSWDGLVVVGKRKS